MVPNENFFDINLSSASNEEKNNNELGLFLKEITTRLDSQFVITYDIEDNDSNPYLPLSERTISLSLDDRPEISFQGLPLISSQPKGSLKRKIKWKLSRRTQKKYISVYLNDKIYTGPYRISGDEILFEQATESIDLYFQYISDDNLRDLLIEKEQQGIDIRLIVSENTYDDDSSELAILENQGIEV